ncbi:hypothetical protein NDU88_005516 [Pleurodeles waltl]|uniref:Uncharacterized protein n=1 Tax=Pleurodeles waltl TaxID=8319 RepID=A0AAV7W9S1_PLEWA|nr:hypothetical protein NDU88_005516 [Pleurodeles waltl]
MSRADRPSSIPQYPRGTIASGLPDPVALLTPSNSQQHPGDKGICNSLLDMTREMAGAAAGGTPQAAAAAGGTPQAAAGGTLQVAAPGGAPRAAAPGGTPGEFGQTILVHPCTTDAGPSKRHPTTAVFSPLQSPEDQEPAKPEIRPRSGESVALAGTVLERTRD